MTVRRRGVGGREESDEKRKVNMRKRNRKEEERAEMSI